MKIGSYTDVGCTRPINEDDYYVSEYVESLRSIYAVVADGMGGHNAGEIASSISIRKVSDFINERYTPDMGDKERKALLVSAVQYANKAVYTLSKEQQSLIGMGTTLTLCFIADTQVTIAHVGDSRAYIIREDSIHKVTTDHSLVSELLSSGQITPEQARNHPQKNVITRAVGTDPSVEVDIYEFTVQPKDILLLCTDGLTNMVKDSEILRIIKKSESVGFAAENLIKKANEQGGLDNITAVLLEI